MPEQQTSATAVPLPRPQLPQSLLAFPVADSWFALPVDNVHAVLHADKLQSGISQPCNLAGHVQVHGQDVLILNLTRALNNQAHCEPVEQIILLKAGQSWTALTTGGISEVLNIQPHQICPVCEKQHLPPWVEATCQADGRTIGLLNVDMLLKNFRPPSQHLLRSGPA